MSTPLNDAAEAAAMRAVWLSHGLGAVSSSLGFGGHNAVLVFAAGRVDGPG